MTAVLPDIDIEELFKQQLPCDFVMQATGEHCPNGAEWRLATACCATTIFACNSCHDLVLDPAYPEIECKVCGYTGPPKFATMIRL